VHCDHHCSPLISLHRPSYYFQSGNAGLVGHGPVDPFTAGSSTLGAPKSSLVPGVGQEPGDQQGKVFLSSFLRPTRRRNTPFTVKGRHGITFSSPFLETGQTQGLSEKLNIWSSSSPARSDASLSFSRKKTINGGPVNQTTLSSTSTATRPRHFLCGFIAAIRLDNHLTSLPRCLPTTECRFLLAQDLPRRSLFQHLPGRAMTWPLFSQTTARHNQRQSCLFHRHCPALYLGDIHLGFRHDLTLNEMLSRTRTISAPPTVVYHYLPRSSDLRLECPHVRPHSPTLCPSSSTNRQSTGQPFLIPSIPDTPVSG
jgi:hypothetical protein